MHVTWPVYLNFLIWYNAYQEVYYEIHQTNIEKQRKVLSSDKVRKNSSVSLFLFKYVFIVSIILIVAGLGLGVGFVRGILKTTPQITKNSVHSKGYITTESMIIKVRQSKLYQTMILTNLYSSGHPPQRSPACIYCH